MPVNTFSQRSVIQSWNSLSATLDDFSSLACLRKFLQQTDLSSVEHSMVANFLRNIYVRLCKHVTRSGLLNNVLYDVAKVFCYLFFSSSV